MNLSFSSSELFLGPKLKIERANYHIDTLNKYILEFEKRNPIIVTIVTDNSSGMNHLCCNIKEDIPTIWSTMIGDAVHNLRSSLDLAANDLVALNGGTPGKASFPISNGHNAWLKRSIEDLKGVSKSSYDIIESIQPHVSGDRTLRELHLLDIQDKHKILLPAITSIDVQHIHAVQRNTGGTMSIGRMQLTTSKAGTHRLGVSWHSSINMEVRNPGYLSTEITFGEMPLPKGSAVVPTLRHFSKCVTEVLNALAPKRPTFITVASNRSTAN